MTDKIIGKPHGIHQRLSWTSLRRAQHAMQHDKAATKLWADTKFREIWQQIYLLYIYAAHRTIVYMQWTSRNPNKVLSAATICCRTGQDVPGTIRQVHEPHLTVSRRVTCRQRANASLCGRPVGPAAGSPAQQTWQGQTIAVDSRTASHLARHTRTPEGQE